jgi:hypothetical protein
MTLLPLLLALSQAPAPEPGFVPLFDGETLDGWVTEGGRYDGAARWSVEDGCIVGRQGAEGAGGLLYTVEPHASFELRLEVKLDHPFDSGVFVRMAPEGSGAQVTLDWREGGEIGAIYSDGFLAHNEGGAALFRRDEWNDLRVRCTGFDMHIEAWLNGEPLVDFQVPAASPGYAPTGLVGLQVHGERGDTGAARFRNVRLMPLALFGEAPRAEDAAERGWQPLAFDAGLTGWQVAGDRTACRVTDGVLELLARGSGGHLLTRDAYQDYRLRLEFKLARMANSGVFLRAARDGSNPAFSGCEVQILDDFDWEKVTGSRLKPWQFTGSLYGAVAPRTRAALLPRGEWNVLEILHHGPRLAVALNGHPLYDVDTLVLTPDSGPPFAERAPAGFIGLQHHGPEHVTDEVMAAFRGVYVQRL